MHSLAFSEHLEGSGLCFRGIWMGTAVDFEELGWVRLVCCELMEVTVLRFRVCRVYISVAAEERLGVYIGRAGAPVKEKLTD